MLHTVDFAEFPHSPVPIIEISLAPVEEPEPEPYSPFSPLNAAFGLSDDMDSYRPSLLSPPVQGIHFAPLKRLNAPVKRQGMNNEQFQQLLRASKEKSTTLGTKKQDLRKEVALKAHRSKQMERRALFLSKIGAPPSPSAVAMPKTPPESPAVFHYSLPSPGLVSPLALFQSLENDNLSCGEKSKERKGWVEQVTFRLPKIGESEDFTTHDAKPVHARCQAHARQPSAPSLEQITERYTSHNGQPVSTASQISARTPIPLPAFLSARRQPTNSFEQLRVAGIHDIPKPENVERYRFPSRSSPPPLKPEPKLEQPTLPFVAELTPGSSSPATLALPTPRQRTYALPSSPVGRHPPLQITTTVIPHASSKSPVELTEANLMALNSRAHTAQDMLCMIRRRTAHSAARARLRLSSDTEKLFVKSAEEEDAEKMRRRNSSPAELPRKERSGFSHPVLKLPGGF